MIELRTPHGSFDLAPNAVVSIVDDNNAFDWDADFSVTRTYPFTLPWTKTNAAIWMHADKMDALGERLSVPCQLLIMGQTEVNGRAYLLQTERGRSYTVNVTYDRELIDTSKNLKEFSYGGNFNDPGDGNAWNDLPEDVKNKHWPEVAYAMPMVRQRAFTFDYINFYNYNTNLYLTIQNPKVPMFYVGWLLEKICTELGVKFDGCFRSDEELQKVIVFNTYFYNFLGSSYPALNPQNHVPKISLKDFLTSLRIRFGLGVDFNLRTNTLYIYSIRDMFQRYNSIDLSSVISGEQVQEIRPAETGTTFEQGWDTNDELKRYIREDDITVKGTVPDLFYLFYTLTGMQNGDIYLVENLDYYYIYSNGGTWAKHSYRYFKYNINQKNKVTDSSSSLITSTNTDLAYGGNLKTPETEYNIPNYELRKIDFGLRYLIYHGLHNTRPAGRTYPYASIDHTDANGAIVGNMELRDDGTYGQYARYKQYRERLRGAVRYPTVFLRKEAAGLVQELAPDKLVRIESNLFAWKQKTRTYNMHGLQSCELKLAKI